MDGSTPSPATLLEVAARAARAGGEVLERLFRTADLDVRRKAENDFVTRADHESEERVVGEIRRAFPDHEVLGEERGLDGDAASAYRWLVDPLDGTTNFLQGLPVFAVSVACQHHDRTVAAAVLDPMDGNLFTAAEGQGARWNERPMSVSDREGLAGSFLATGYPFRAHATLDIYLNVFRDVFRRVRSIRRCGAAALDLAYTAAGVYDGFFEFQLSPWDFAAGDLLMREAGGKISDLDGSGRFYDQGNIIAGAPHVHRELLVAVRRHVTESSLATLVGATDSAIALPVE